MNGLKIMSREEWQAFVDKLINEDARQVVGPRSKGEKFVFDQLDSADELRLDHDVTILPPKKYFLPTHEDLMTYDLKHPFNVKGTQEVEPRVIIGMHPYDIKALLQMDKIYLGDNVDTNYKARRDNTLIIASDILTVSENSFAASMDSITVGTGFDLLVTVLGDKVAVQVGSEAGQELLAKYGNATDASQDVQGQVDALRNALPSKYSKKAPSPDQWTDLLSKHQENGVWDENSKKCLECGSCTMVCPTCYCYDVDDVSSLDLKEGARMRTWDGCLLREFTLIGSGEIFREDVKERYKHRFYRKGMHLPKRYGDVACVGCGRCVSACLPDIADPSQLMDKLSQSPSDVAKHLEIPKQSVTTPVEGNLLVPEPATIRSVETLTDHEKLFVIELDSGKPLGHSPGQFVEVSIFGIGEAPISVSSAPGGNTFEMVVRKVGDVTEKLHGMKSGDKVGIRGPFGHGFNTGAMKGKNVLFICGGLGIVPARSLINFVIEHRMEYGQVMILYGCKEPSEFLFKTDSANWMAREDIQHITTVDTCREEDAGAWDGEVGLITTIMPLVTFNPEQTIAVVVGPPVMYKFVIRDLKNMGVPDDNIMVSLERRMKCGVGKCGHCQMNGVYVCKEGPVFTYKDIKDLPEAI